MISEEEARSRILNAIQPLPARRISLLSALDCFAAEDYFARLPLPNFDNSAMDGYAVIASSIPKSARLKVIGEQPAGVSKNLCLSPGEAIRIFTGAPLPKGDPTQPPRTPVQKSFARTEWERVVEAGGTGVLLIEITGRIIRSDQLRRHRAAFIRAVIHTLRPDVGTHQCQSVIITEIDRGL